MFSLGTILSAFLGSFIPGSVGGARLALGSCLVVDWGRVGTNLTRLRLIIPNGFINGANTVSWVHWLEFAFFGRCIVDFSFFAGRIALVGGTIVGEVSWAAFAGFFSQTKVETFRALEAVVGDWTDVGLVEGTTGLIVLDAVRKDLVLVLIFCDVSIDPIFGIQVIFVLALTQIYQARGLLRLQGHGSLCTIGSADFIDDANVVLLLEDAVIEIS